MSDVTHILERVEQGDPKAADELLPLVYDELRKLSWTTARPTSTGRSSTTAQFRSQTFTSPSSATAAAGFFIRYTGAPDVAYRLQRAASVTGPWSGLATNTAPASGLIEYHETSP